MKNSERYTTAIERLKAFEDYTRGYTFGSNAAYLHRALTWLDEDVPQEDALPCPFCGMKELGVEVRSGNYRLTCDCGYESCFKTSKEETVAAHNRVVRGELKNRFIETCDELVARANAFQECHDNKRWESLVAAINRYNRERGFYHA